LNTALTCLTAEYINPQAPVINFIIILQGCKHQCGTALLEFVGVVWYLVQRLLMTIAGGSIMALLYGNI